MLGSSSITRSVLRAIATKLASPGIPSGHRRSLDGPGPGCPGPAPRSHVIARKLTNVPKAFRFQAMVRSLSGLGHAILVAAFALGFGLTTASCGDSSKKPGCKTDKDCKTP